MRIGFASADFSTYTEDGQLVPSMGGSGHYRCKVPADALRANGHDVELGTLVANRRTSELGVRLWETGDSVGGFDVIVLQRWMHEEVVGDILAARAIGQVVVNDVDDWWEGLHPSNRAYKATSARNSDIVNRDHYRKVLAASTAITCSTPFLAERYARLAPTFLVRNAIDIERWTYVEPTPLKPRVGWVGAIPWRSGDLKELRGVVGPWADQHDARLVHCGHVDGSGTGFAAEVQADRSRVDAFSMVPIEAYPSLFSELDVGLVPMSDIPFNHAKSAIKGMEYAAAGVPFTASQLPEYQWLCQEHGVGRTWRRPKQLRRDLDLFLDYDFRVEEAKRNRTGVEALAIGERWRDWELSYEEIRSL